MNLQTDKSPEERVVISNISDVSLSHDVLLHSDGL